MDTRKKESMEDRKRYLEETANLARMKQAVLTVIFIVVILAVCLHFGYPDDQYQIEKEADKNEGYLWKCKVEDESVVKPERDYYANGTFVFVFKAGEQGKTKVFFTLTKGESNEILKEETTTVSVDSFHKISFNGKTQNENPLIKKIDKEVDE